MTITPDRLDDLDFPTPEIEDPPNLLENVDFEGFRRERLSMFTDPFADPLTDDSPWELHGYLAFDHADSWCSPSRGRYFERLISWPEPITFTRWEPPLPPVMSKELAVIQPNVF